MSMHLERHLRLETRFETKFVTIFLIVFGHPSGLLLLLRFRISSYLTKQVTIGLELLLYTYLYKAVPRLINQKKIINKRYTDFKQK